MRLKITFFCCFFLLLTSQVLFAGVWRVSPMRIDLDKQKRSVVMRVSNSGEEPVRIQINSFIWEQSPIGEDQYIETGDLLTFPKLATIKPGETQIIRVGIKRPALDTEKCYRLFLEEIPPASQEGSASISVALRVGIPVFAAPLQPKAKGGLSAVDLSGGLFSFSLNNTGNITNKLSKLNLTLYGANAKELFSHELKAWYLLPSTTSSHQIEIPAQICPQATTAVIDAVGDRFSIHEKFPVSGTQCN